MSAVRVPDQEVTPARVLDCPMATGPTDGDETVRGYLGRLLATLWEQGEEFKAKRPFGDSGWEFDLYLALVTAGFVDGHLDEAGDLEEVDVERAGVLIAEAIAELTAAPRWGERVVDGGEPGTIVRCDHCGGSGELHRADNPAAVVAPQPQPTCGQLLQLPGATAAEFVCALTGEHAFHRGPLTTGAGVELGTTATWQRGEHEGTVGVMFRLGRDQVACPICDAVLPVAAVAIAGPEHASDCQLHRL